MNGFDAYQIQWKHWWKTTPLFRSLFKIFVVVARTFPVLFPRKLTPHWEPPLYWDHLLDYYNYLISGSTVLIWGNTFAYACWNLGRFRLIFTSLYRLSDFKVCFLLSPTVGELAAQNLFPDPRVRRARWEILQTTSCGYAVHWEWNIKVAHTPAHLNCRIVLAVKMLC